MQRFAECGGRSPARNLRTHSKGVRQPAISHIRCDQSDRACRKSSNRSCRCNGRRWIGRALASETYCPMVRYGRTFTQFPQKLYNNLMLGRIISASLLLGCLWNVYGQVSSVTATDPKLDRSTLYILFLNQHALDAKGRLSGAPGARIGNLAEHLRVRPGDLQALDGNALSYVAQDKVIHQEALAYFHACQAAHRSLDPVVVHSFTLRRTALAVAAFSDIQSRLSPESFGGLQEYLSSTFLKSLHVMR